MIIHLMCFSKTSREYIKFITNYFPKAEHRFILWKGNDPHGMEVKELKNIEILKNKKELLSFYLKLFKLRKYEKIIIHGWYYPYFSIPLFLNKFLLKKIYWCMWGADVYTLFEKKLTFKAKIYHYFDRYCKCNINNYLTQIREDYNLLKENYRIKGKHIDTFMYPSNLYKKQKLSFIPKNKLSIQIGNSAEERNHLEVLKKLILYQDRIEKIYLPLSYGNTENYIDNLLKEIPNELKNKVVPILKVMPFEEYINFLSKVDIAIFPFKQQQAFGNIISLLGMKKTVYLKEESTTYKSLKNIGLNIKSFNNLKNLEKFNDDILEKNKEIIKERFSEKRLIEDLKNIFEN